MSTKKVKKKAKKKLTPAQLQDRRFSRDIEDTFVRAGFSSFQTDGKHFKVGDRKGEIDHIYVVDNVLVVCERTTIANVWSHLQKKLIFFAEIAKSHTNFMQTLRNEFPEIEAYAAERQYENSQYQVRIMYASIDPLDDEHKILAPGIHLAENRHVRYFATLSRAIRHSARVEIYKFLAIAKADVGEQLLAGSSSPVEQFPGSLLPENYSSFPSGYKLVSFYADPKRLLQLGYVLRRDGWEAGVYQRMVIPSKLRSMRNYLSRKKRIYINNIIVTLPATTTLNDPQTGKNIDQKALEKPRYVQVSVPNDFNTIGIVDGQHRVLSYHEGDDTLEAEIKKLREKQNLLITGIIYPEGILQPEQVKFEAGLFLDINSNQTTAKAELRQAIQVLVDPFAEMAIARAVADTLSTQTPLVGFLQSGALDDRGMLKISSIVSYGLKPLLKLDGDDSLFSIWPEANKEALVDGKDHDLLANYIKFATKEIRLFLNASREALGAKRWQPKDKVYAPEGMLTTTFLNGLFVCLRRTVANEDDRSAAVLKVKLANIENVDLSKFKRSSLWAQLGDAIYKECFS